MCSVSTAFSSFFPVDCIFHCLNIPQNSPNLKYMSHLLKNIIMYCCPQFPPQGGAIIKGSAFWIITHVLCCTFKHLISTCSLNCAESCHFRPMFFATNSRLHLKDSHRKPTLRLLQRCDGTCHDHDVCVFSRCFPSVLLSV